ncbi:MAG: CARDB domain-containing protein, partial [Planctomycetota bacterium]
VAYSDSGKVFYGGTLDTAGGSSGSSVWEQLDNDDTPMVLGVHGYGSGGGQYNSAARITQRKFNDIELWEQADLAARAPTDKPDLASVASFMPSSPLADAGTPNPVPVGGQLDLDIAIRNFGTLAAQGVTVDVYISDNTTITSNDTLLKTLTFDEVLPFETAIESFTTAVPDTLGEGTYSIGFIIDAGDNIDEFVETNNATAVSTLSIGSAATSGGSVDRFETNETFETATNLGTLGDLSLTGLNIHDGSDEDFFVFTADATGNAVITLNFTHNAGDIDTQVLDANGNELDEGISATNNEVLNFSVTAGEQYFLRVYGWNGATNSYAANFNLPGVRSGGPSAIDARFAYQAAQQFTFDFDFSLDLATVDAGDVLVTNLTTGQTFAGDADFNFAGGSTSLTWAATSVLPDGNYRATIPAG